MDTVGNKHDISSKDQFDRSYTTLIALLASLFMIQESPELYSAFLKSDPVVQVVCHDSGVDVTGRVAEATWC